MPSIEFTLPPRDTISANNEKDPLPFYYKRSTGWLYRHRLQMGLNLLPPNGKRLLEVGVGSGILIPTLTAHYQTYLGTDLVLAAGLEKLVTPGCDARFATADLLDETTLPANSFDAIVCFSVMEHIRDSAGAARSLANALAPGGTLITGYPMVSALMTRAFEVIGYKGIDDDHVAPPVQINAALSRVLTPVQRVAFPPKATIRTALYQCSSWRKV
jgi:SAM-dependent methyltransferase